MTLEIKVIYLALPTITRTSSESNQKIVQKSAPYHVYAVEETIESKEDPMNQITRRYFKVTLENDHLIRTPLEPNSRDYNRVAKWIEKPLQKDVWNYRERKHISQSQMRHSLQCNPNSPSGILTSEQQVIALLSQYVDKQ